MVAEAAAASGTTITASFEKLFLSSMRFSGAATLYGVEQFETALNVIEGGEGISKQMDKFGTTVESLTKCLVEEFSPGKKDVVESVSNISKQVVHLSFQGMSFFDPREILRLTNNLTQKSSEAVASWVGKKEPSPGEEPKLAAEVLAS